VFAVRPSRRGRGAELADPCRAALILIIRAPASTFTTAGDPLLFEFVLPNHSNLVVLTATINCTLTRAFAHLLVRLVFGRVGGTEL
jgi:hypothetical protein